MNKLIYLFVLNCFFSLSTNAQEPTTAWLYPDAKITLPSKPLSALNIFAKQQPSFDELNEESKEFYYYTNYLRHNPRQFWDSIISPILETHPTLKGKDANSLKEELFKIDSLPLFSLNSVLIKLAKGHALDIADTKSRPIHSSTNGTDFATRIKSGGFNRCAGENLALGIKNVPLNLTLLLLDIGLDDKGHRKALLNARYEQIGVWVAIYGADKIFLVQDFACR
jgi:Cysteine-rich secretory protein family